MRTEKFRFMNPADVFSPEEWQHFKSVSSWRGLAPVAHGWAVIALALALVAIWPNPLTWFAAILIIGARQLGLAVLMHDAAHGLLHPNRKVNNLVAQWTCAAPVGSDVHSYRQYHLRHHRNVQTEDDPDIPLASAFPVNKASLRRKVIRDLTGQTFFKQRVAQFSTLFANQRAGEGGKAFAAGQGARRFLIFNILLAAGLTLAGYWWLYFGVWLVAMATWHMLIIRVRNIAEHSCVPYSDDPLSMARTTYANWLERALIAPYYVNFHVEHHAFMGVPCYRLPGVNKYLRAHGYEDRMTTERGYLKILRIITDPSSPTSPGYVPAAAE